MEPKDINLDTDLDETAGSEEEIKSGLKIRTNLKAGALTLASRGPVGTKGMTDAAFAAPEFNVNVLANAIKY